VSIKTQAQFGVAPRYIGEFWGCAGLKSLCENSWIPAFAGMTGRNTAAKSSAVTPAEAGSSLASARHEFSHRLPWGRGWTANGAFSSRGGPGLRPPKGKRRAVNNIGFAPPAGEGVTGEQIAK
jgi:hypothetical protein